MSLPIPESPATVIWTRVAERILADSWLSSLGGLRSLLLGTLTDLLEVRSEHLPAIVLRGQFAEGTWYDERRESLTLSLDAELTVAGSDVRPVLDLAHRLAVCLHGLPQCADTTVTRVVTTALLEDVQILTDPPAIRGRYRASLIFPILFED